MLYIHQYLDEAQKIIAKFDCAAIQKIVWLLADLQKNNGRLFFLGVGGGAAYASHAVNDFRKIAGIEAYAPTDNVSELTARMNDDGWDTVYESWLKISRLSPADMIFVFSVGGGDPEHNISGNLVRALQFAGQVGARVCGVVGRNGGFTAQVAEACVVIPTVNPDTVTPHTESMQALIWHLIVSHPLLRQSEMKWESLEKK
jgi:D-sedoheptulose 7-phosphate isomerase